MSDSLPEPPDLDPATLASGSFTRARKGFEPIEVNKKLGQAADALRTWQLRDRSLIGRIEELERELGDALKLDEGRIASVLGEETAKVISAAREAATEIRAKAEEHAARLVKEAEETSLASANALRSEAEALRAEAETLREQATREYALKLEEAQRIHDELISSAEARHDDLVEAAEKLQTERMVEVEEQADRMLEAARLEGREMVAEARSVRDRILADLAERRRTARRQIEGSVVGRDRIIEVMKQAGADIAAVIADLEGADGLARDAATQAADLVPDDSAQFVADLESSLEAVGEPGPEEPQPDAPAENEDADVEKEMETVEGVALPSEPESEVDSPPVLEPGGASEPDSGPDQETESELEREVSPQGASGSAAEDGDASESSDDAPSSDPTEATVHDLFARIRAQGQGLGDVDPADLEEDGPCASDSDDAAVDAGVIEEGGVDGPESGAVDVAGSGDAAVIDLVDTGTTGSEMDSHPELDQVEELARIARLLDARDELLVPVERQILRSLRRLASDEQNEVLDRLRRHKRGRPGVDDVIPGSDQMLEGFSSGILEDWGAAIEAGFTFWGRVGGRSTSPAFQVPADTRDRLKAALGGFISVHRAHLERAVAQADEAGSDIEGLAQSIKSVYRDWRQSALAEIASDLAIGGFSHGERSAAGPGTPWMWVVDNGGIPCADGEDNALAGAVLSDEAFPTGDFTPPAHTGCRCILVPADN